MLKVLLNHVVFFVFIMCTLREKERTRKASVKTRKKEERKKNKENKRNKKRKNTEKTRNNETQKKTR